MKNPMLSLLLLVILLGGCATINYRTGYYGNRSKKPMYSHTITDSLNLPYRLLISDEYLKKNKRIFMVIEDYAIHYSRLVEYDLTTSTIAKEIASYDGDTTRIADADIDVKSVNLVIYQTKNNESPVVKP